MRDGFVSIFRLCWRGGAEAVPEAVSTSAFWELRSSPEFTFSGCEVSFEEIFEPRFSSMGFRIHRLHLLYDPLLVYRFLRHR